MVSDNGMPELLFMTSKTMLWCNVKGDALFVFSSASTMLMNGCGSSRSNESWVANFCRLAKGEAACCLLQAQGVGWLLFGPKSEQLFDFGLVGLLREPIGEPQCSFSDARTFHWP